jgi:hypothetical protein
VEQRHLRDQAVGVTVNDGYALQYSAPLVTKSLRKCVFGAPLPAVAKDFARSIAPEWPVALEMNEHVIQHGRMFSKIDDEMAPECLRDWDGDPDDLWFAGEKGTESFPSANPST